MPNENDSNPPRTDREWKLPPPRPATPPAPLQRTLPDDGKGKAEDTKNEADELAREFRVAEKWVIGTNITIAVIGVIALCIYYGQLKVMRGQLGEIIKQFPEIQKSANAAKDSADAASDSVTATQAAMRADQRGWIIPSYYPDPINPVLGQRLQEPLSFVNSGKTPVRNIRGIVYLKLLDNHEVPEFGEPIKFGGNGVFVGQKFSVGLLFPNIPKNVNIQGAVAKEPEFSGYPRDSYVALYGRITYYDVFGHEHWVHFCSLRPIPRASNPNDPRLNCIEYNDVDKDAE